MCPNFFFFLFAETFSKARAAVPHFIEDSNYETEMEAPPKRRRIRPRKLSSSDDDEIPIRKQSKACIPPPPAVSSKPKSKVPRKGQGLTKEQLKKREREELMGRLKKAREAAAAKMAGPKDSPWKVTPSKGTKKKPQVIDFHYIVLPVSFGG